MWPALGLNLIKYWCAKLAISCSSFICSRAIDKGDFGSPMYYQALASAYTWIYAHLFVKFQRSRNQTWNVVRGYLIGAEMGGMLWGHALRGHVAEGQGTLLGVET